jgi:hypothetical protein
MMRKVLNSVAMDGVVVIGEGEKDEVCDSSVRVWARRGPIRPRDDEC